jgi:outer membrane protein TolC
MSTNLKTKARVEKMKKYMFRAINVVLTILLCTAVAYGQQKLTLEEAISLALKNNYDIRLIKNDAAIAKNNANWGNAGMLPLVTGDFSTGGSRQNTVQTQASGTERRIDGARNSNMAYGVGLNWTIFDGFSMFANYDRLKALQEQGEKNATAQIFNTITDVINAYYNMSKQQQLVIAADSTITISAFRLRIAKNKLQLGRGSKLDVLAAQVDYNADTSAYLQQKNLLNNQMVTLNQLLARDVNTKFTVENYFEIDGGLNYTTLASQMEQLNPNLQSALLNKKIAS